MSAGSDWFCIQEDVRILLRENSDQKRVVQFLALGCKRKKKTPKSENLKENYGEIMLNAL